MTIQESELPVCIHTYEIIVAQNLVFVFFSLKINHLTINI